MKGKNYSATIEVEQSPEDVFNHINNVSNWWATKEFKGQFEGHSTKLNDEFVVRFADAHYSKIKLVEVIPNKKIVWLVMDSKIDWIKKDKTEWTNTRMIFDISTKGDKTVLVFTHEGLVPEQECYVKCEQGWDMLIKTSLLKSITEGKLMSV
jgi:Activator of Hsp90 ATPase homolog 1-like protein